MSYNTSNHYSPCYQSQGNDYQTFSSVQQNSTAQYQDDGRLNNTYSNGSYQPLSAYQSDHQRQQQNDHSGPSSSAYGRSGSYRTQKYNNLPAATAEQTLPTPYATSKSDTSALGNLAYVSSLGQGPQPSLSQLIDYNRSRDSSNYADNSSCDNTSGHDRSGGNGQSTYGNQQSTQSKTYSTAAQDHTNQPSKKSDTGLNNIGRSSPAQHQYSNPPLTQQSIYQANSDGNQYTQQSAASITAPSMSCPKSRPAQPSIQSPQLSTSRGSPFGQPNGTTQVYSKPQNQNSQQNYRPPSSTTPGTSTSLPKPTTHSFTPTPNPASQKPGNVRDSAVSIATKGSAGSQIGKQHPAGVGAQSVGQPGQNSPQSNPETPTTVDPSQVFNNYEYQRRQSEFEAARKEAEASLRTAENAKSRKSKKQQPQSSPPTDDVTQAARALMGQSGPSGADGPTKELSESEMKAMIEKMRDYKAQNPGLFSQVWEQVKHGTPTQKATSKTPAIAAINAANESSASPDIVELPAESDLDTAAFPPGFDRGRYPKERRRRANANFTPDRPKNSHKKKSAGELNLQYQQTQDLTTTNIDPTLVKMKKEKQKAKTAEIPALSGSEQLQSATNPSPAPAAPAINGAPPPTTVPGGNTFWPEDKKRALAEAAVVALKDIPANSGKFVDANEVHNVLNGNPSYNELCQYLERRGFIVSRGPFARQLLTAVPDMGSKQKQPQVVPEPPAQTQAPVQTQPPFGYLAPVTFMSPSQMPMSGPFAPPQPPPGRSAYFINGPAIKPEAKPVPLTKAEKARKRNISDIVDLTAFEEDDEFLRHRPKPRIEPPKPIAPQPNAISREPLQATTDKDLMTRGNLPQTQVPTQTSKTPMIPQPVPSGNSRERYLYEMVAEPMNKREDALRRSLYDVRTIARDILLATGIHPTLKSLNQHLDPLKDRFISVDQNTDLSTFRWDLVDPGGPPGPRPVSIMMKEWRESLAQVSQNSTPTKLKMPASQITTDPEHHAANIPQQAVDPPIKKGDTQAAPPQPKRRGRPPKYRPSNVQPLGNPQPVSSSGPSSAQPSQLYSAPVQANASSTPRPVSKAASPSQNDFDDGPLTSLSFSASENAAPASASQPRPTIENTSNASTPIPVRVPGRKGRPPGAKNKQPRADKGVAKRRVPEHTTSPSAQLASHPSISSLAHQQIKRETEAPSSSTNPPVRQSGLRNVLTPSATSGNNIAVVIPSRSPSTAKASPSSGRRNPGQVKMETGGTHNPTPFKCRWEACGAEYPKIDPLRRHVRKVHREDVSAIGPWECRWADCYDPLSRIRPRKDGYSSDESGSESEEEWERDRVSFSDSERWDRHVERKHIAVYLPGGGLAGLEDIAASPYMSDTSGRRVTPLSSPHNHSTDPLPLNTDPLVVSEYHTAHETETDEEKRNIKARALEAKKEKVGGPGIYKTGFRMVNGRQRGLLARGTEKSEQNAVEVEPDTGKGKGRAEPEESSEDEDEDEDVEMID